MSKFFRGGSASLSKSLSLCLSSSRYALQTGPRLHSTPSKALPLTLQSKSFHSLPRAQAAAAAAAVAREEDGSASGDNTHGGAQDFVTKFADLASRRMVANNVVNTLTNEMKLVTMTPVQSQTIDQTLKGRDV